MLKRFYFRRDNQIRGALVWDTDNCLVGWSLCHKSDLRHSAKRIAATIAADRLAAERKDSVIACTGDMLNLDHVLKAVAMAKDPPNGEHHVPKNVPDGLRRLARQELRNRMEAAERTETTESTTVLTVQ